MNYIVKIHAEAQSDYGGLQEKLGQAFALDMERVREREAIHQATQKSKGRRDQAACREDNSDKKQFFVHKDKVCD